METKKRKNWLDAARGMAMLFVIFGHTVNELVLCGFEKNYVCDLIFTIINPVKVPLFFAVSGYLFSGKDITAGAFFKKMISSRIIPYFFWGLFSGLVAFGMDFARVGFDKNLMYPLFAENCAYPLLVGNLIWFIPCLIVVEIIFFAIKKMSKDRLGVLIAFGAVCTVLGYMFSADSVVKFWKIDTALTCMQFMTFGYVFKIVSEKCEKKNCKIHFAVSGGVYALMLCVFCLIWNNCRVDVNMGKYFNPAAFSALSLVGIYAMFNLAQMLEKIKPINFVGRNTFVYFVWHMYVIKVIMAVWRRVGVVRGNTVVCALIVMAVACGVTAVICVAVNKYLAFSVGRKKLRKEVENG